MAAIVSCPSPNGSAIAQGENACSALAKARLARPAARYQAPTANIGRGSTRQEARKPRLKMICQRPGSIHSASESTRYRTTVSSVPATPAGMEALRARHHLDGDQDHRDGGGRDPQGEIAEDVGGGLRNEDRLRAGCQQ